MTYLTPKLNTFLEKCYIEKLKNFLGKMDFMEEGFVLSRMKSQLKEYNGAK